MGRDTFHRTRLLKAPANLALNAAREGAATASLGSLCQDLTTLMVKKFFLISNLLSFSLEPFLLILSLRTLLPSEEKGQQPDKVLDNFKILQVSSAAIIPF